MLWSGGGGQDRWGAVFIGCKRKAEDAGSSIDVMSRINLQCAVQTQSSVKSANRTGLRYL